MTHTQKASLWQNHTITEIREVKRNTRRLFHKTRAPLQLWDFCMTYVTELRNRVVCPMPVPVPCCQYGGCMGHLEKEEVK
jgi:hypothetical protein